MSRGIRDNCGGEDIEKAGLVFSGVMSSLELNTNFPASSAMHKSFFALIVTASEFSTTSVLFRTGLLKLLP